MGRRGSRRELPRGLRLLLIDNQRLTPRAPARSCRNPLIITLCPRVLSDLQIGGDERSRDCSLRPTLAGSIPASIGTRLLRGSTTPSGSTPVSFTKCGDLALNSLLLVEVIQALHVGDPNKVDLHESTDKKASRLRVSRRFSFVKNRYHFKINP